jgi:hypothetical protein
MRLMLAQTGYFCYYQMSPMCARAQLLKLFAAFTRNREDSLRTLHQAESYNGRSF